jgi:hypothetical protein
MTSQSLHSSHMPGENDPNRLFLFGSHRTRRTSHPFCHLRRRTLGRWRFERNQGKVIRMQPLNLELDLELNSDVDKVRNLLLSHLSSPLVPLISY